ncbi:MAG: hypothetical protein HYR64_04435 [Fimbriimonas ginsengisoli]|uniref:ArsR family transcriptional regulator n=1 Tax=Fimbriimonas ginsengisoli TaxID=1005039 RepID=A0A931LUC9_FIMGI|nr:hypothetical protein [Fimbriimonas ginsengisoli]
MTMSPRTELFGSRRRTQVLELIALLENSYATEIARLVRVPLRTVQRIILDLEVERIVVTRISGRERWASLDRRSPIYAQLRELLLALAASDQEVWDAATRLRRRPRRIGKPA